MTHRLAALRAITLTFILFLIAAPGRAIAQAAPAPSADYQPFPPDQLDNLTAPVALYPDALLSEILVAATYPQDVVQASQWLAAGNDPNAIDSQPWDPSVKGLAHYPGLLPKLASDPQWLNDLGAAFLNQQADVMASVQRLRAQAIAAGTLYSGPQQQVVQDGGIIEIIPTNPDTIYIPTYDPNVAYEAPDYPPGTVVTPLITWGDGYPVGVWLGYDYDWYDHALFTGNWGRDRPWWNWHDRDHLHYDQWRPGHFGAPEGAHWEHAQWNRDRARPLPVFHPLPARGVARRPLGGPSALPEYDRGVQAARDAERGRAERERAAPAREAPAREPAREAPAREPAREAPAREAPAREPVREAPAREPVREAPAREAPAREPVRQAPVREAPVRQEPVREAPPAREAPADRGAAVGGYSRGEDAARASERGGASRGAPAGGGGAARGGRR